MAAEKRPQRELYDLRKDPDQMKNVAGDPAYAAEVRRLESLLLQELRRTGDPRAVGRGEIFESYPYLQRPAPPA